MISDLPLIKSEHLHRCPTVAPLCRRTAAAARSPAWPIDCRPFAGHCRRGCGVAAVPLP